MRQQATFFWGVFCLLSTLSTSHSKEPQVPPSAIIPQPTMVLRGSTESWRNRALKWYESADLISRRKQMRQMSRPLKRPCYYCHTRNFKDYVDSKLLISLQMMAISAEQDVSCAACHIGKRGLTTIGAKSLIQWRYAADQQKDCKECHVGKSQFKQLNEHGEKSRKDLMLWLDQNSLQGQVPSQILSNFKTQIEIKTSEEKSVRRTIDSPVLPIQTETHIAPIDQ